MYEIFALAQKDLKLLLRDKAGFFFTFFFPLIYAIFFGVIMSSFSDGPARGINLVVVDEDKTAGSAKFIKSLNESSAVRVYKSEGGKDAPGAAITRDQAINRVRRGDSAAYIVLTPGFGAAIERAFWGDPPKVEIGIDPARQAEAGMLQGVLTELAARRFGEMFSNPAAMRQPLRESIASLNAADNTDMDPATRRGLTGFLGALDLFLGMLETTTTKPTTTNNAQGFSGFTPIEIQKASVSRKWEGPKNPYEITFPQAVVWGLMGCAAAFGISLVVERRGGTLTRLQISPLNQWRILAGKALACFITTLSVAVFLLLIATIVFGVRPNSPILLAIALLCIAACFVGIMMLLSVMGKTEQSAGGIGWAVLLAMAMLGGGMIPLFVMPPTMQTLSHVSPIKWSILAMEGAIWRGFSPGEMLLPCGILLGIGAACFSIGVRAFQWMEKGG